MQPGLSAQLRRGRPSINADLSISVFAADGSQICLIPSRALVRGGIGYVFERFACLDYERRGYVVEQRSSLGYLDRGIDLVADAPGERIFVQCKFTLQSFGPKKIEQLLYAASSFIKHNLIDGTNYFDLVVPALEIAFPRNRRNGGRNAAYEAFLARNRLQRSVVLRVVEVPIELPDVLVAGDGS
ncbi:hypothetical protein C8239_14785 [Paracidovorax avenae]|uniref:restriction endonuclease n=1 Tax=Paracidovorax avenae TaxID=80867 RepID=UPI000D20643C|nr:restriction endonuclease [Paracidovorax avenae]AVS85859.1 hypothetical protein C8239_14785 [Paracidovorax avenae]